MRWFFVQFVNYEKDASFGDSEQFSFGVAGVARRRKTSDEVRKTEVLRLQLSFFIHLELSRTAILLFEFRR
jgi:hypothetical protein